MDVLRCEDCRHLEVDKDRCKSCGEDYALFEGLTNHQATEVSSPSSGGLSWQNATRLSSLLIDGLNTDGAHHKQYYLEEVLRLLAPDEFGECKAIWQWEDGIAP